MNIKSKFFFLFISIELKSSCYSLSEAFFFLSNNSAVDKRREESKCNQCAVFFLFSSYRRTTDYSCLGFLFLLMCPDACRQTIYKKKRKWNTCNDTFDKSSLKSIGNSQEYLMKKSFFFTYEGCVGWDKDFLYFNWRI